MKLVTTIDDWLSRRTGGVTPRKKKLKLFTTIYDDARLLGHFLAHYDRPGVTQFFIAVAKGYVRVFWFLAQMLHCGDRC